jgi:hypothetical protein
MPFQYEKRALLVVCFMSRDRQWVLPRQGIRRLEDCAGLGQQAKCAGCRWGGLSSNRATPGQQAAGREIMVAGGPP